MISTRVSHQTRHVPVDVIVRDGGERERIGHVAHHIYESLKQTYSDCLARQIVHAQQEHSASLRRDEPSTENVLKAFDLVFEAKRLLSE